MARNAEKANAMLSRWVRMKKHERDINPEKPSSPSKCNDIHALEKFRRDLIKDITRKITDIQNPGLGEFRLRDLNDEINHLIKEKRKYEKRIKELDGPDYLRIVQEVMDDEGAEIVGTTRGGYKYFGATRQLPGVKELFENQHLATDRDQTRSKYELAKYADIDYYGFRDTNDLEVCSEEEDAAEVEAIKLAVDNWNNGIEDEMFKDLYTKKSKYKQFSELVEYDTVNVNFATVVEMLNKSAHEGQKNVAEEIPDPDELERILVEKKKKELLNKYTTEDLLKQETESKKHLKL